MVILIMLAQALPVYVVAVISKNQTYVNVTALLMSVLAIAKGSPIFLPADFLGLGIAYWLSIRHIKSFANRSLLQNVERCGYPLHGSPSDLLKQRDAEFITSIGKIFGALDPYVLNMVLVAYRHQKLVVDVIENGDGLARGMPRTLDELIRLTDPFVNKTPHQIAFSRRYWFTIAALLMRAERLAATQPQAAECCVGIWLQIVRSAQFMHANLVLDSFWSEEEKELIRVPGSIDPRAYMKMVHDHMIPSFARSDIRMKKIEGTLIYGMREDEWEKWQTEKSMPQQADRKAEPRTSGLDS